MGWSGRGIAWWACLEHGAGRVRGRAWEAGRDPMVGNGREKAGEGGKPVWRDYLESPYHVRVRSTMEYSYEVRTCSVEH